MTHFRSSLLSGRPIRNVPFKVIASAKSIPITTVLLVLSFMGITSLLPIHGPSACNPAMAVGWQLCGPIESSNGINIQPSVIQASDGTMRMAWTGRPASAYVILYASGTWNATASAWNWNPSTAIATQAGINQNPSLAQLPDQTVNLFFAYKSTTSGHYQLYYVTQNGGSFDKAYTPVPLTTPTGLNDTLPSTAVAKDGTLWLVWTRDNSTAAGGHPVMRQLWYKTMKGSTWSTERPLTSSSDLNWNFQPSVVAGRDGIIRVAYSSGPSSTQVFQIKYITYNGSVWSPPVQLTTQTTMQDEFSSMMQDRNGTFWIFWSRNIPIGTSSGFVIFSRYSTNNGAVWTTETQMTSALCGTVCFDSEYPAAVQSTVDKNIWVFHSYNPVANFNIYALETTSPVFPVHDVSIYNINPNTTLNYAGGFHDPYTATGIPISWSANILVQVGLQNTGDFNETVTLSLAFTNTTSYRLAPQILTMRPGSTLLTQFLFNTTGVRPARYGLAGNASIPVVTLGNKLDGLLSTTNAVHLLPLGDLDQDGSVTITDISIIFYEYGFTCYTPATCSPRFQVAQWGDINGDGIIDIVDVGVVLNGFGTYT